MAIISEVGAALATVANSIGHIREISEAIRDGRDYLKVTSRFNEHLMANKSQAETLEQQIASMRGHCLLIKEHAETVKKKAGGGMRSLAAAFGLHSSSGNASWPTPSKESTTRRCSTTRA